MDCSKEEDVKTSIMPAGVSTVGGCYIPALEAGTNPFEWYKSKDCSDGEVTATSQCKSAIHCRHDVKIPWDICLHHGSN